MGRLMIEEYCLHMYTYQFRQVNPLCLSKTTLIEGNHPCISDKFTDLSVRKRQMSEMYLSSMIVNTYRLCLVNSCCLCEASLQVRTTIFVPKKPIKLVLFVQYKC
jgi:hypothetical protein